jgi:hypothetical protein
LQSEARAEALVPVQIRCEEIRCLPEKVRTEIASSFVLAKRFAEILAEILA